MLKRLKFNNRPKMTNISFLCEYVFWHHIPNDRTEFSEIENSRANGFWSQATVRNGNPLF